MNKLSTLEEAKSYIYNFDLSAIIEKIVKDQGWLKSDALVVSQLYRDFLFLQRKYGESHEIVPTKEIDEFWHNHILDTCKYHEDCQAIFGKYLHHYPYFGIDGKSNKEDVDLSIKETLMLHEKEFGNDDLAYNVRNFITKFLGYLKRRFIYV